MLLNPCNALWPFSTWETKTHTQKKPNVLYQKHQWEKKFTRAVALSHFELQLDNYEYVMLTPLTFPLAVHYIDISNDVLPILDCSKIIDEESPSPCCNSSEQLRSITHLLDTPV